MGMCFVPLCTHKGEREGCKMFCFPKSPRMLQKWKKLIRRGDRSPNRHSRVCSCHFVNGCKDNGPSLMPWSKGKQFSPEERLPRKRRTPKAVVVARELLCEASDRTADVSQVEVPTDRCEDITVSIQSTSKTATIADLRPEHQSSVQICVLVEADSLRRESLPVPVPESHSPFHQGKKTSLRRQPESSKSKSVSLEAEDASLRRGLELSKSKSVSFEAQSSASPRTDIDEQLSRPIASKSDFASAAAENTLLESEELEHEKTQDVFKFRSISDKDTWVSHFTGLPNQQVFMVLLKLFDSIEIQYCEGWQVNLLDKESQLFLTLLKLRRGLSNLDLAVRFKISEETVANIFITCVLVLHHVLVKEMLSTVPSREKLQDVTPACFSEYPNTRLVIHCTEVTTANPSLLPKQNRMLSNYKERITWKALVGIAPNGTVTFVSKLYGGIATDRNIVIDSEVLKRCVPGDGIIADKGFNIEDLMPDGVTLNKPTFKMNLDQAKLTSSLARARILIERAIARIKTFEILRFIPKPLLPYATEIFQVCAALTNLKKPLINDQGVDNIDIDGEDD